MPTSFHGTSDYCMATPLREALFLPQLWLSLEMPGRGLEPLRISPPDPKSGASANFATLANCDAHELRCVGRFGQIALVSFLRVPATNPRMPAQEFARPVFLPIIIGTPRQGRLTEPAANFVFGEVSKRSDIKTELIDIRKIPIRVDDAGEALKDSQFCATVAACRRPDHRSAGIQSQFPRPAEACARHKPEGIHSQSGRRLWRVGWSVRRRAHDPEFAAGAARTRPGHDFLGCLFRHSRKAFRSSDRQDHRSSLHRSRGEIPKRTCLDGARARGTRARTFQRP